VQSVAAEGKPVKGPIRWIVSDVMGVIFDVGDDTNDLLVPYIRERPPAVSSERINALYLRASLGEISSERFWEEVGLGDGYPDVERDYLDTRLSVDPEAAPVFRELGRRFSLGILSNDVKEWSAYLRRKHGLDDLLKVAVISGEVGLRKPDRRIFEILLERTGASPSECAIVDDLTRNLQAAAQLGMKTVHFLRGGEGGAFAADWQVRSLRELASLADRLFA